MSFSDCGPCALTMPAEPAVSPRHAASDPGIHTGLPACFNETFNTQFVPTNPPITSICSFLYNPAIPGIIAQDCAAVTMDIPPILLVDDDDNAPDVRGTYTAALDSLGLDYDIWDTNNSDNEPDAATLQQYDAVFWFTGDEFGGAAGPGAAGESALATYLDADGCFFISSQDYVYDRGVTAFMQSYLGIASAVNDVSQTTVIGADIFAGLGPYTLAYPFTNYSDRLTPAAGAATAFNGDQGSAAVRSGTHNAVFLGFPAEALPDNGEAWWPLVVIIVVLLTPSTCSGGVPPPPPTPTPPPPIQIPMGTHNDIYTPTQTPMHPPPPPIQTLMDTPAPTRTPTP